jgi:NAD(P)-dependent dehydrogenase (short-subunit alcohol dehydrogenase family)
LVCDPSTTSKKDKESAMDLQGKRIIVTGSARGMGAATVRAYVKAGAEVIGMDLSDEAGTTVCRDATAQGPGTAAYLHVDVSSRDSVESAFAEAAEQMGGLDALAHPAAIQRSSDASDVSVEDWDLMFAVNVRGTMLTNQVAHGHMQASGGGSIINFGSISGQRSEPSAAAYSAAKGAVHSWTRTAAGTWGVDNIRVNAILPAMVTPMYEEARARPMDQQRLASYQVSTASIAMGGVYGDPDKDLGPVMVFFASDASWFITGQLIPVDGGQTNVR